MDLELKEYKLILNNAPNLVWRSGTDGKCDFFNNTWLEFTGRTMEDEVGDGWAEGVHSDDLERCINIYMDAFSKQIPFEMEYRLRRFDGKYRIINDRGVPSYDSKNNFLGYIGSCIDVTEKIEGELLKDMAIKDGLTNLYNRQYLIKLIKLQIEMKKSSEKVMSLIMIDIDNFKYFNDNYGHTFGDEVIVHVARVIEESVRENDVIGRYGGDEFIILLPNSNGENAISVAERLCNNLSNKSISHCNEKIFVEVSIGVSQFKKQKNYIEMIDKVDKLMYKSKNMKGNYISYE